MHSQFHSQSGVSTDSSAYDRLTSISEKTKTSAVAHKETCGSRNYEDFNSDSRKAPVRTSSDLRPEVQTRQGVAVNSSHPRPPRPYSLFSVKTQAIEDRRPILRRMLDAGGCTKSEKFDIHDFSRVPAASQSVATYATLPEMEEMYPRALRKESWRESVCQMLYPTPSSLPPRPS